MTMREGDAEALFVTQYYRPELIGSGPFCGEIAEWLNQNGRRVTVLTGLPHYPLGQVFAGYEEQNMPAGETLAGVHVERLRTVLPKRGSAVSRILAEGSFLLGGIWAL